jgi:phosphatidylinositol alpha-1,6-mannosyltransferase
MEQNWILVTCDYPPMKGGVARYLSDLVAASQGAMKVTVPLEHGTPSESVLRRRFFGQGPIRWWPLVGLMKTLGKEENTCVFISHALPIGTAAWIASYVGGAKYILLFHGLDLHLSQRSWIKRWLTQRIVRRAEAICVNSAFVARECKELFPWVTPVLLTPGYEPHTLPSREDARKKLGISPEEVILLNVTRLIPRKGLDRLIEVLPKLDVHVRAVSIGDGSDRARLEGLARVNGARITFIGAIDDHARDEWYAAADVFVFPVRPEGDDLEGYGIVCLEAAAAGLPVIVGKNGGAPETVVEGETGFVVDADQKAELRAAIERLVRDPALRKRFGEQGRARVLAEAKWSTRWNTLSRL